MDRRDDGVASPVFLAALASACIAVLDRTGPSMWLPTVVDSFLALNFAGILVGGLVTDPDGVRINLGEYLSIPPLPTTLLLLLLFCLPLASSAVWAFRRTSSTPA